MEHELKCWSEPFDAIRRGEKCYEIRKNDRDFKVGDTLLLRDWNPVVAEYSYARIIALVTHITHGGQWGLPSDLCVMGIRVLHYSPKRKA